VKERKNERKGKIPRTPFLARSVTNGNWPKNSRRATTRPSSARRINNGERKEKQQTRRRRRFY
jgi:hypothetical protein